MLLPPACTFVASRELSPAPGLLARFEALRRQPYPWLLDSSLPSPRLGRWSFAGAEPYAVLRVRGERCELECRRAVRRGLRVGRRSVRAAPLELLRALAPPQPEGAGALAAPFVGGAVGYFGYELAARFEALALRAEDDLGLPDAVLLLVDRVLAHDHASGACFALGLGFGEDAASARRAAEHAASEVSQAMPTASRSRWHPASEARSEPKASGGGGAGYARAVTARLDYASYAKAIERAREEIAAGNVYQACLTRRVERSVPRRRLGAASRAAPAQSGAVRLLLRAAGSGDRRQLARALPGGRRRGPRREPADQGHAAARRRSRRGRAPAARAARLRQGSRREPDDRRPRAQRSGPRLRARQRRGPGADGGRGIRFRVSPRLDGPRPPAPRLRRARRAARGLPARLHDGRAQAGRDAPARPARAGAAGRLLGRDRLPRCPGRSGPRGGDPDASCWRESAPASTRAAASWRTPSPRPSGWRRSPRRSRCSRRSQPPTGRTAPELSCPAFAADEREVLTWVPWMAFASSRSRASAPGPSPG